MQRRSWTAILGVLVIAISIAAQSAVSNPPAPSLAADRLRQLARGLLEQPAGHEPAMAMVQALLEEASGLAGEDAELWRLRIEAAEAAGHGAQELRELLSKYLKSDSADDVAQLRLAELLVQGSRTAAERAAVYESMVDRPRSAALSRPLRSRLAWTAAMLHRDRGDEPAFRRLIKRALELDPATAPAAAAAYRLFAEDLRTGEDDLFRALLLWHAAAPADPHVHLLIARSLMRCAHYQEAAAWFDSADRLAAGGRQLEADQVLALVTDWSLSLWAAGEPKAALELIGSLGPAGQLPAGLLSIRVAVTSSVGDADRAAAAFADLAEVLRQRSAGHEPEVDRLADRVWAHLLYGRALEEAEKLRGELEGLLAADDPRRARLDGWMLLRRGQLREAHATMSPAAAVDLACALGVALATEDATERIASLTDVYRRAPESLLGIMALQQVRQLGGAPAPPTRQCQSVAAIARQIPPELRRIGERGSRFVALRLTHPQPRLGYGQPVSLSLELTNVSQTPLTLGPDGTVHAIALLTPKVTTDGMRWQALEPQVVDLYRRLVLAPGSTISVDTILDGGELRRLLDESPDVDVQLSVTAVLNPHRDEHGRFVPGLLGAEVVGRRIERPGVKSGQSQVNASLERLAGDGPQAMFDAAWLARFICTSPAGDEDLARRAAAGLTDYYQRAGVAGQVWIASFLTPGELTRQRLGRLIGPALRSDQPAVQYALLLAMCDRPDAPELTTALRSGPQARAYRFAVHLRDWINSTAPVLEPSK